MTQDVAMLGAPKHERHDRDFYETIDENVTRAISRVLIDQQFLSPMATVWECAAGNWAMGRVLEERFAKVIGSDIVPLADNIFEADFLHSTPKQDFDAIVTNQPFGEMVTAFMARGVEHIRRGNCKVVAMLGRNELDSSGKERTHLFGNCPEYAAKVVMTWRPKWIADSKGSPRHSYAWFIWSTKSEVIKRNGPGIFYAQRRQHS